MKQSQNFALAAAKKAIAEYFPEVNLNDVTDRSVKVSLKNTGGPSGGLIFALGIVELFTPTDILQGRKIAGTGTIDESGTVGEIGGIREKLYSATRAGASWFLAPAKNCAETVGHVPAGLTVIKIQNFQQALTAVKTIAATNGVAGLPLCPTK